MTHTRWPLAIIATDGASAGVCLWRQRGQLYATVAVKATFALVPGGAMVACEPALIEPCERPSASGHGIDAPGDLAPCLLHPEIWVVGHAHRPPAPGASSVRVGLALAGDASLILAKSVEIPVGPGPFVPPFLHAFAPLSRKWPIRTRLLGGLDPGALDRSPVDLPDRFDWTYFQAAPPDQRTAALRGDEWILLDGVHPRLPRLHSRLPRAYAAASLFGPGEMRSGLPIRIGLDSIQVDADRGTCALVFRGYVPLPDPGALGDMRIVAGVGLPHRPLPRFDASAPAPPPAPPERPPEHSEEEHSAVVSTLELDPAMVAQIAARAATPFRKGPPLSLAPATIYTPPPPPPSEEDDECVQTRTLDPPSLERIRAREVIPFKRAPDAGGEPLPPPDPPGKLGAAFLAAVARHRPDARQPARVPPAGR